MVAEAAQGASQGTQAGAVDQCMEQAEVVLAVLVAPAHLELPGKLVDYVIFTEQAQELPADQILEDQE